MSSSFALAPTAGPEKMSQSFHVPAKATLDGKADSLLQELHALKQRPSSGRKSVSIKPQVNKATTFELPLAGDKWANAANVNPLATVKTTTVPS